MGLHTFIGQYQNSLQNDLYAFFKTVPEISSLDSIIRK